MSAGTYLQLVRNVVSNVKTFRPDWVGGPAAVFGLSYADTVLATGQYLAVPLGLAAASSLVIGGVRRYLRVRDWLEELQRVRFSASAATTHDVIECGLMTERNDALTDMASGVAEFVVALAWFVLGHGTLSLVQESVVVDALWWMNAALVYFLWLMWEVYAGKTTHAARLRKLATALDSNAPFESVDNDGLEALQALCTTCYEAGFKGMSMYAAVVALDSKHEPVFARESAGAELLEMESDALEVVLGALTDARAADTDEDATAAGSDSMISRSRRKSPAMRRRKEVSSSSSSSQVTRGSKARMAAAVHLREKADRLKAGVPWALALFILNVIAFYGYSLSILAFYYASEDHAWHRWLKFGMTHANSDWWGNVSGDIAWTIEPLIVLYLHWVPSTHVAVPTTMSVPKAHRKRKAPKAKTA